MTKIKSDDWRNLPIERWNTTTVTVYLEYLTQEKFGVTYQPTGGGSKQQRWSREKGMMKNALNEYGPKVVRKFIEISLDEYKASTQYPYASFTFIYSYRDGNFAKAERMLAEEKQREESVREAEAQAEEVGEDWF